MTGTQFVAKWRHVSLTERSAAQQHFLDLCELVGHPKPAEVDKTGDSFTFERGAAKQGGGDGWADVWKKGFVAGEYKGKHKDLDAAYGQLLKYRDALENPPLLMTCDMDRIIIHTNFTACPVVRYELSLDDLATPEGLDRVWSMFFDPEALRPGTTCAAITARAAGQLADLAQSLRARGLEPRAVAHFLDRIVFCLFAEDVRLLPEGLFSEIIQSTQGKPERFTAYVAGLFAAMASGGDFLLREIRHFNGSLFDQAAVLELSVAELRQVHEVAKLDWSAIDPTIFGTLFVRGMDPALRSQLGAEFTGRADIEALIEPVVMAPLRREWAAAGAAVDALVPAVSGSGPAVVRGPLKLRKAKLEATLLVQHFLERLAALKILDPACGSGNFLYVVLQKLKDLEKEVIVFAQDRLQASFLPVVGPWQLYGLEINPYAHDLAQMTVWIGYLQWTRANGFGVLQDPVLKALPGNFRCQDAILDLTDPAHPHEPEWPAVDYLIGNPPFLGGKLLRRELGDAYVDRLFAVWADRVPHEADLCCYWFEKARAHIESGACHRAGLLATQGIRGGANRKVLARIKASGDIFFAESDRPWILDGASVHISMVGFDGGGETRRVLDGRLAPSINANLTSTANLGSAVRLSANAGLAFMGDTKGGSFDLDESVAIGMLSAPNPHGRPNSDVLVPWVNGKDLTGRARRRWIVDYGVGMSAETAARYADPFGHVLAQVKPLRADNARESYRSLWWQHVEARSGMLAALQGLPRFVATPRVAKHRLFVWLAQPVLADSATFVFARSDDYLFGVLHSRIHELWALELGTRLETRPRYTPTSCFETFPFPWAPGHEPAADPLVLEIGAAAAELCRLRDAWLNPPEWVREEILEFPATVGGPWDRFIANPRLPQGIPAELHEPDTTALEFALAEHAVALARREAAALRPLRVGDVGVARYPRLLPRTAQCAELLAKRTLTTLYNQRPVWLDLAHRRLDEGVAAAYGSARGGDWSPDLPVDRVLEQLLALNLSAVTSA
jgi:hypothetical protein